MGLSGRATALRIAVLSALLLLLALPAGAHAASTVQIRTVVVVDLDGFPFDVQQVFVQGDGANNVITVDLAGGTYTVSDTTGATAGAGCTQGATTNTVTCPAALILESFVEPGAGNDTVTGSSGADTIMGGPGNDVLHGGPSGSDILFGEDGNDVLNSGGGGIPVSDPPCGTLPIDGDFTDPRTTWCNDVTSGGPGFDTITYEDRVGPITIDLGPSTGGGRDDDGTPDRIIETEKVVGGMASDELIGGLGPDTFDGGPGEAPDTICGGLGNDTVDYSAAEKPVTVTLDGVLPTDPDVNATDSQKSLGARRDCRLTIKTGSVINGTPCQPNSYLLYASCRKDPTGPAPGEPELRRDCTVNDGVEGENDCVGEDTENIIGSRHNDVLIGNDTDPSYGQGPRAEPSGANVLTGGGGDDVLDGSLGPDVFVGDGPDVPPEEVGDDAVSYEGRAEPVAATLDGSANDGSARDRNPENNASDQITSDVEDLIGGDGSDLLKGDRDANVLLGGPGDDLIQGHGAADRLGGDAGADTLEGGEGGDAMDGGLGDDYLFGGFGADGYEGGDGSDTADFSDATTPVSVTPNGAADDGSTGEGDNVAGSIESLIGGLDDDRLTANDGNGFIEGGGGNDSMNGGPGDDALSGGAGVDTAEYFGRSDPVGVSLATGGGVAGENDVIAVDVESIGGTAFDDVLSGDAKDNFINGRSGNDRISGAEGGDFLAGDLGNDTITGDAGGDTLDGAEGNDTLNGTAGNDTLLGFTGTDILDGGTGSDTMSGGDGVDTATYATRSGDVTVDTLGAPDDGEKGENDQVRTDVESVRTGSGDDNINISDGAAGAATCGGGTDVVKADAGDEIGSGCESQGVSQSSACLPTSGSLSMSSRGAVSVRMRCSYAAKGSIQLRSAGRVKVGKGKARKLNLGKKSFTGKAGQVVTVKLTVAKSARSTIKRRKKLRVEETVSVKRTGANAATRKNTSKLTLRASGK